MKRILLSTIVAVIGLLPAFGETVSQKQAHQLAQLFFNEASGRVTAPPKLVYNGRKLTTDRLFNPFYVYNTSLGGFVIISAENKAYPILGFSLKDGFDPDRLSESELALLRSYAREIELIRYDGESVVETERAWQHYAEYIDEILKAKYIATDPKISTEESYRLVYDAIYDDDAVYSDIYTPQQWNEVIGDELRLKESAPLVLFDKGKLYPMVVYGRQGDYFRIEMSFRNSWLMRLNATEIIPSNMASVVMNPLDLPIDLDEETPFADYDSFLDEVYGIENSRQSVSSIDRPMIVDQPLLKTNGGGHYEITLPENVSQVNVYNLSGSMVRRFLFNGTAVANIDISAEPSGFYILTLIGESGQPYGMKISR